MLLEQTQELQWVKKVDTDVESFEALRIFKKSLYQEDDSDV